jgi:hypothetical protein
MIKYLSFLSFLLTSFFSGIPLFYEFSNSVFLWPESYLRVTSDSPVAVSFVFLVLFLLLESIYRISFHQDRSTSILLFFSLLFVSLSFVLDKPLISILQLISVPLCFTLFYRFIPNLFLISIFPISLAFFSALHILSIQINSTLPSTSIFGIYIYQADTTLPDVCFFATVALCNFLVRFKNSVHYSPLLFRIGLAAMPITIIYPLIFYRSATILILITSFLLSFLLSVSLSTTSITFLQYKKLPKNQLTILVSLAASLLMLYSFITSAIERFIIKFDFIYNFIVFNDLVSETSTEARLDKWTRFLGSSFTSTETFLFGSSSSSVPQGHNIIIDLLYRFGFPLMLMYVLIVMYSIKCLFGKIILLPSNTGNAQISFSIISFSLLVSTVIIGNIVNTNATQTFWITPFIISLFSFPRKTTIKS